MMKPEVPLLWLPGLLCDETLFQDVNKELPNWVAPFTCDLGADTSMQALASKVLDNALVVSCLEVYLWAEF